MELRGKRGHTEAMVAVPRHMVEETSWFLKKAESYKERKPKRPVSSTRE
jgi:hypothetical protein